MDLIWKIEDTKNDSILFLAIVDSMKMWICKSKMWHISWNGMKAGNKPIYDTLAADVKQNDDVNWATVGVVAWRSEPWILLIRVVNSSSARHTYKINEFKSRINHDTARWSNKLKQIKLCTTSTTSTKDQTDQKKKKTKRSSWRFWTGW